MAKDLVKAGDDFGIDESDMMMFMMIMVMAVLMQSMATNASAAATAQTVQSLQYEGKTEPREIDVPSDVVVYIDLLHNAPMMPWTWALFENMGPNDVEIGINEPNDRFILAPMGNKTVNRLGARERISIIFFYCKATETAHVNVVGEY